MPEHGVDGGLAEDAADTWQRHRQQHFVEPCGHGEKADAAAGDEVVPAHVMEAAAGHRQSQIAEHPFFQWVERTGDVEGNGDRKQADGEVHQVGVQRNRVGKVVGAEGVGDVVDRRCDRGEVGHDTTP